MPAYGDLPLPQLLDWALPSHGLRVETIDAHAGGQSLRLILNGVPPLGGRTMAERQGFARENFDHLRRALLFEPRGHADMYGCLLTPPQHSGSQFGVIFMHRGGFSAMCGHGIIALTTILLESGLAEMQAPETRLKLDTAAGMVRAYGVVVNDKVERVFYESLPSRVVARGLEVMVTGLGKVEYDVANSGSGLAFVDAQALKLPTTASGVRNLVRAARAILASIRQRGTDERVGELFGVVFVDRPMRRTKGASADGRQVCVFADGCVDRSPGGMVLSARLALMVERGEIGEGKAFTAEGITGSSFRGRVARVEADGGVICEIEGRASITGQHQFLIAADDPFRSGFLL